MRWFLLSAISMATIGCATFVELHKQAEAKLHETSAEFSKYQKKFHASQGCQNKLLNNRIVGGSEVTPEDPLAKQAVLILTEKPGKTSSCTAVPMSENILMTAAHCVADAEPAKIKAVFKSEENCHSGSEEKVYVAATRIAVHPDYDRTPQSKADLALIKLSKNIPGDFRTASLYDGKSTLSDDQVVMLGFGITGEDKQDSMILRTTKKSFKTDAFVKGPLIGFNQTGKSGGYCRGDSGAPIFITSGGMLKVIGVNSFNVGKEKNRECHTASFGMYTPYFKNWILTQAVEL